MPSRGRTGALRGLRRRGSPTAERHELALAAVFAAKQPEASYQQPAPEVAVEPARRRNAYAIGRKLNAVDELQLYRADGFESLGDWAEAKLELDRRETYRLSRIAGTFEADTVATVGVDRLDRGLAIIAKLGKEPADLLDTVFEVPGAGARKPTKKVFRDMTTAETKRAIQHLNGLSSEAPHIDPWALRAANRAERALDATVGKAYAGGANVGLVRADGEVFMDVGRIPWKHAAEALRAIAAALDAKPASPKHAAARLHAKKKKSPKPTVVDARPKKPRKR